MCFLIESVLYFKHRQSGHYLMVAVSNSPKIVWRSNCINHEFKSCHIVPAYLRWVMTRIVIVGLYYKSKIVGFNP